MAIPNAPREDSDQTVRMIRIFVGRMCRIVLFLTLRRIFLSSGDYKWASTSYFCWLFSLYINLLLKQWQCPIPPQSSIVSLPTPRITSATQTYPTLALGCYFHGVLYTPNTQIEKNDCVQIICNDSAQIRRMETPCITPARPTKEITTTLGGPIPALACYFNGHFYPPDTYMGMGIDSQQLLF